MTAGPAPTWTKLPNTVQTINARGAHGVRQDVTFYFRRDVQWQWLRAHGIVYLNARSEKRRFWDATVYWKLVAQESRNMYLIETFRKQADAQAFCDTYLDRVDEELEDRVSALNEKQRERDGRIASWGSDLYDRQNNEMLGLLTTSAT